MASKHETIKWQVISDWSVDGRGRLYCMNQGMAIPIHGDNPIWFGPLKRTFKGFPDLFGFEYGGWADDVPIFTLIEVKTKAYPRLSKHQKLVMNFIKSIGGRCYVAMEADNEKGYTLKEWTDGV